jgi:hypothetical protein
MFNRFGTSPGSDGESSMKAFVPATQWDELRKLYPPRPSRRRGLRGLSQAMATENPENIGLSQASTRWSISPQDCVPEQTLDEMGEDFVLNRVVAELDACFSSDSFLDDLDWELQTYDLCEWDSAEDVNLDTELGMLEAVQDLTRYVARTTPRRVQHAPSSPSLPD